MKRMILILLTLLSLLAEQSLSASEKTSIVKTEIEGMKLTIGDREFTATFAENSSAETLRKILQDGPVTIDMHDYAGMEKVGSLGRRLPRNDEQITAEAGDLILYLGSSFVIYYDRNSWNFTRLGKINNITKEELKAVLGDGDVIVTLSHEDL